MYFFFYFNFLFYVTQGQKSILHCLFRRFSTGIVFVCFLSCCELVLHVCLLVLFRPEEAERLSSDQSDKDKGKEWCLCWTIIHVAAIVFGGAGLFGTIAVIILSSIANKSEQTLWIPLLAISFIITTWALQVYYHFRNEY